VTPLLDGMNLVAMEYVAAQNPVDPACGAVALPGAATSRRALLVNRTTSTPGARPRYRAARRRTERRNALGGVDGELRGRHHPPVVFELHRCAGGDRERGEGPDDAPPWPPEVRPLRSAGGALYH